MKSNNETHKGETTLGNFLKKLIEGGPEHQKRKQVEREAKAQAFELEMKGYKAGLLSGAEKRGFARGEAKGEGKSGLGGVIEGVGRSAKAFKAGGEFLVGGMDFGNVGSGLTGGIEGIGFGGMLDMGGGSRQPRRQRRKHRNRNRNRGRGGGNGGGKTIIIRT